MKVRFGLERGCLADITRAASLAHLGLIGSPDYLAITCDLSSIPSEKLASLVSSVTRRVYIRNVSAGLFCMVLKSLKCDGVYINEQSLGTEETQALVQAMETAGVGQVKLGERVTLDMEALLQYSGLGRCGLLEWYGYEEEELRSWARNKNWTIEYNLQLERGSDEDGKRGLNGLRIRKMVNIYIGLVVSFVFDICRLKRFLFLVDHA